jgi:hypothetical protein
MVATQNVSNVTAGSIAAVEIIDGRLAAFLEAQKKVFGKFGFFLRQTPSESGLGG